MRIFIYGNDGRLAVCRQLLLSAYERGELVRGVRDIHLLPIPSYRFSLSDFVGTLKKAEGDLQENARTDESEAQVQDARRRQRAIKPEARGASRCEKCLIKGDDEKSGAYEYDLIVGYGVQADFYDFPRARVLDLEKNEPFLRRNARLTALGTVGVLLCEHTRALPELCVGIIGCGRIGRELVDILSFLACRLVVFSASTKTKEELLVRGIQTVSVAWQGDEGQNINDCLQKCGFPWMPDILLNTSPSKFANHFFDGYEGKIYDLASGEPIPPTVEHTRLASLPKRMYCDSAGRAVYESVLLALYEIDREQIR